jgi:RimJ/RimL family protein N-acetyltransferase
MDDAFRRFDVERVVSMIRPENAASRRVAEKNGLKVDRVVFWRNYDHCVYQRMRSSTDDQYQ